MIRSMTAFNRKQANTPWGTITWELRSVNHRHLEIIPRLPETLRELENKVREQLRQQLSRGKLECTLRLNADNSDATQISVNSEYVQQLLKASHEIQASIGSTDTLNINTLMQWPGVLHHQEADMNQMQLAAIELLNDTLQDFIAHREREGKELKTLIETRLAAVEDQVTLARDQMPVILQAQKQRLINKIQEAQVKLDAERLEQEIVYITQKSDIDEELDRLNAHIKEVRHTLNQGGTCGRRLDFLMQELNREANTLGSKSLHVVTTQVSVELKVLIEQMREQIQNIE